MVRPVRQADCSFPRVGVRLRVCPLFPCRPVSRSTVSLVCGRYGRALLCRMPDSRHASRNLRDVQQAHYPPEPVRSLFSAHMPGNGRSEELHGRLAVSFFRQSAGSRQFPRPQQRRASQPPHRVLPASGRTSGTLMAVHPSPRRLAGLCGNCQLAACAKGERPVAMYR